MNFPSEFERNTRKYLGEAWDEYVKTFEISGYFGLRVNPLKTTGTEFLQFCPYALSEIPWCDTGYYYDETVQPAKHPYYHAGLYYIQEPSAMLPASLLPVEPGDKVLDLCAAPGGKSTQIAGKLMGKGVLVSNDISVSRARALVKNLEMAGAANAIVTSEKPEKLAKVFRGYFDKVLVDAPCSGEGMFRRQPQMMRDWEEKGPEFYSELQKEILEQAVTMLAPGGKLVYSTCTFSPQEDEAVIDWILEGHPELSVVSAELDFPGRDHGHPEWIGSDREELSGAYRMWPHRIHGEGHFAVLLAKEDGSPKTIKGLKGSKKAPKEMEAFLKDLKIDTTDKVFQVIKDKVYLIPDVVPEMKGIRIVRSGLYLGDLKKNRFEPSQSLAMAIRMEDYKKIVNLPITDENVVRYLKCETIMTEGPDGWVLVCVDGFPLGWGKLNRGQLKNKYAAAWRWM